MVALLSVSYAVSYAALLFADRPPALQAQGLFMLLLTVLVLSLVGAALCTLPATFLTLEGATIAATAAGSTALLAEMGAADPGRIAATLGVGLMVSALATGLGMLALGVLRGGAVIRFVPLQVMAGVIAASGWTLLLGGVAVITHRSATPALLHMPDVWPQLAVGATMAAALILLEPRLRTPLALPGLVALLIGLQHAILATLGLSIAEQRQAGWLIEMPVPPHALTLWHTETLAQVDWVALSHEVPALFTILAIAIICALLNTGGVELGTRRDIDLDRDLRANGLAVLMAGLLGGVAGSVSLSRTLLLFRLGSRRRLSPALAGVLTATLPLAFPSLLGLVPRTVLGALLVYVAWGILRKWAWEMRHRLSRVEWCSLLAVLATGIQFGLVAGMVVGLVLSAGTFAVIYSLGSPIRARYAGDVAQSNVARTEAERAALHAQSTAVLVLYVQGFLFFGTASRLLQEVKREIAASDGRLRFLLLDGSNLDGLDGSARAMLERLMQVAGQHGIDVSFTALRPADAAQLAVAGLRITPTLDEALERCEGLLLQGAEPPHPFMQALAEELAAELAKPGDIAALAQALVPSEAMPGQILMHQGEPPSDLIFLESGRASVLVAYEAAPAIRVRTYGAGAMLGEIGFLLGTPRTATVRADTPCRLWSLSQAALDQLEREHPSATLALQRAVMRRLSTRLLDKDQLVAALLRGTRRA